MRKWLGLLIIIMVVLVGAAAGEEEAATAPEAKETKEAVVLEEVVITATGTEVRTKETSVSSTVITEKEIEERQATRVEEMMRAVPGVNVVQTGSRGGLTELYIRGGESNHNLVLFNGIRLNEVGGGFNWSDLLTLDNLQRIEVVRGPMSALYGVDALTGVINLTTQKGHGPPTLRLTSAWGAHSEGHSKNNLISEQKASLTGSYKKFSYSVAYSRIDDTGILPINNRYAINALNSRFDFDATEKLSFTFNTLLIDSFLGFPTENNGDRFDPKNVGGPGLDPNQNSTRLDLLLGLTCTYWPTDWWENQLTLSHVRLDKKFNDPANPLESDVDLFFGYNFSRNLERYYSINYRSNFRFGDESRVASISTVGLELRDSQLKQHSEQLVFNETTFMMEPATFSQKFRQGSVSGYFQEQLSFWKRLFFTAGLRIEDNRDFNKVEFAPRASAALRFPETDTTLRAAGGRGIKAPSFLDLYGLPGFQFATPNLKPEENISWEVGVDQYLFQNRLQFGVTYFENHFTNFITAIPSSTPRVLVSTNIGAVRTTGLEFAVRARPGWGLTLGASYTHFFHLNVLSDDEQGDIYFAPGQKVLRRPRNLFSFDVNGQWDRLGVHLNGLYVGPRDDNFFDWTTFTASRVNNSGYFILNLAASYDLVQNWGYIKKVQLLARANNLLDRDYMEAFGYSSPRFNAVAGLRAIF